MFVYVLGRARDGLDVAHLLLHNTTATLAWERNDSIYAFLIPAAYTHEALFASMHGSCAHTSLCSLDFLYLCLASSCTMSAADSISCHMADSSASIFCTPGLDITFGEKKEKKTLRC